MIPFTPQEFCYSLHESFPAIVLHLLITRLVQRPPEFEGHGLEEHWRPPVVDAQTFL